MKIRVIFFFFLVIIACVWWLSHLPKKDQGSQEDFTRTGRTAVPDILTPPQMPAKAINHPPSTNKSAAAPQHLSRAEEIERSYDLWRTPIAFYGKVLDEHTNPVSQAHIDFDCNDLSPNGTSYYHAQSDDNGFFSLTGIKGKLLGVNVHKDGYYPFLPFGSNFFYAGENENFVPDSSSPVVFYLRKKGQGVQIYTSENGIRPNLAIRLPKDNTPLRIDFFKKQPTADGQLELRQIKPPWREAKEWSFGLRITGGGLIENTDHFQFQAPESGYSPFLEYIFKKTETNWTTQVTKQFYIAFGQPPRYGWLRIESDLAQETIFLTYAINLSGSRNLEPANH